MKFHFYKIEIEGRYIYRLLNNTGNIKLRNIVMEEEVVNQVFDEYKKMIEADGNKDAK